MEEIRLKGIGRPARTVALLVIALLTASLALASPASAVLNPKEKKLAYLVNKARSSHSLAKLKVSGVLSDLARKHSAKMHKEGNPVLHSTTGQMYSYMDKAHCVAMLGENVGMNYTVPLMHQAFMKSTPHRHNVLGSQYKKLGVGVKTYNGRVWVTELFCV